MRWLRYGCAKSPMDIFPIPSPPCSGCPRPATWSIKPFLLFFLLRMPCPPVRHAYLSEHRNFPSTKVRHLPPLSFPEEVHPLLLQVVLKIPESRTSFVKIGLGMGSWRFFPPSRTKSIPFRCWTNDQRLDRWSPLRQRHFINASPPVYFLAFQSTCRT